HHLVRTIPAQGLIVRPANSPALDQVIERGCWTPVHAFGQGGLWEAQANDHASHFQVLRQGREAGTIQWSLTGEHNRMNALAALAAAEHLGIDPQASIEALSSFRGVKRRMELRGTRNVVDVYDDFAHHPTAIATTLEGL